jgi:hypothetical protein
MKLTDTQIKRIKPNTKPARLNEYGVGNLLAAHCTGMEATYRLRDTLHLSLVTAVVASVGSSFSSLDDIKTRCSRKMIELKPRHLVDRQSGSYPKSGFCPVLTNQGLFISSTSRCPRSPSVHAND